jgi:RNA polymerase sigma-70 factor (family 1)
MDELTPDIISLIRQGDQKAFERLFREYYARLCEYSFLLTKDKESSAEIVQDFFVKLWENHSKLDIKATKSYLFRSIHNNTIKYLRKETKFESLMADHPEQLTEITDLELSEKLEKSLNELPPKCKEIFILSRIDKLKHNEIAEKLGISTKTVEVQIRKANIILREKLKEFMFLLF